MKWALGFFTVACRNERVETWEGLVNEAQTFALHHRDGFVELTHVPSGKRIASALTLAAAVRVAHQLAELPTDWTAKDIPLTEVEMVTIHRVLQQR